MLKWKLSSSGICLFLFLVLSAARAQAPPSLPAPVLKTLAKYRLPADSLSVFIQDVTRPQPLLAFGADIPRNPASVIKVITTFVALDMLGPAYTWKTEAYANGPIDKGRLQGDLLLKGYGDPFLVTEHFWKLLRGIRDHGVHDIAGSLLIDNRFFAPPPYDPGAFDNRPFQPYNAGADALLLNFQSVSFTFSPDRKAKQVSITPDPRPANLKILNSLKYVGGKCRGRHQQIDMQVYHNRSETSVRFAGNYPASCDELVLHRTVLEPVPLVYGVFRTLWSELGGTLAGQGRMAPTPAGALRLFELRSRPLAELLHGINKYSNNVMARQLLFTLGAERYGPPGTPEKGRAAIKEWLRSQQLSFPELVVDNGAGLSRLARISARSLGRFLVKAYGRPYRAEFLSSLPLAGVDGTLRKRFKGEALAGQVRMKTGTLDGVRAIAGYLSSRSGRTYAVAMLQNYPGVDEGIGTQVQDVLLRWLFAQ